jgi:hypothetical protein
MGAGDRVTIADKKSEWPGWLWCAAQSGKAGWIPAAYVERKGTEGILLVDYDGTELTVAPGEVVEMLRQESGWAWCRKPDATYGWLPLDVLESPAGG